MRKETDSKEALYICEMRDDDADAEWFVRVAFDNQERAFLSL